MLKIQGLMDFMSENEMLNLDSSQLFSFSQLITESEFVQLSKKLMGKEDFSLYWSNPSENRSFLALGEVYSIYRDDITNLSVLDEQLKILPFKISYSYPYLAGSTPPLFVGGIKFPSLKKDEVWNDFEFAKWSIPQILLQKNGDEFQIIIYTFKNNLERVLSVIDESYNLVSENEEKCIKVLSSRSNEGIDEWSDCVNLALRKISDKKLQKVVVSRFNQIELNAAPDLLIQLQKLENDFDNCVIFAYKSKDSIFFGATPEKLFRVKDGFLEADALAGSMRRGLSEEEDDTLKNFLLHDEKNLAEHKSVLDFIINQLSPVTDKILFDSQPSVKKYANIQHLYSMIRAVLKKDVSFFTLLERLYPTPAVCGFPSDDALDAINELELFDRGLYSGVFGWFNLSGNAEFSVGIRSALLKKNIVRAYAGCGIVQGSDSISEFKETELKLKPILNLFKNETKHKP